MQDFRKLEVGQVAHALTLAVYRATASIPDTERFGLTSQLRPGCSSIGANLAEGCGRGSDVDFARFTQIAMGSASEVEYHLMLVRDLGYKSSSSHDELAAEVQRVKRMLASLLKTLRDCNRTDVGNRTLARSG